MSRHAIRRAVDVHTHVYLPGYMNMLRNRTVVPRVIPGASEAEERLIILPGEDEEHSTSAGRPIGDEYWSMERKLKYMDLHGIQASVLSLANPWLDFLEPKEAVPLAKELNEEMDDICEGSNGRLYGFGVLPAHAGADAAARELQNIAKLKNVRGIILGTHGVGNGLDDPALVPMFQVRRVRRRAPRRAGDEDKGIMRARAALMRLCMCGGGVGSRSPRTDHIPSPPLRSRQRAFRWYGAQPLPGPRLHL